MNCKLCQKEMDAYRKGKLPGDMMIQVEYHLKECKICAAIYKMEILAEKVIDQEKQLEPDPFIATRIMAFVDNLEESRYQTAGLLTRIMKPVLITVSMAAAIFFGIILGDLSVPVSERNDLPIELALIDDASIESVNILLNE